MEKLYMKFREELENWEILNPDSPSFEECIEEVKRLWCEIYSNENALVLEWYWILAVDNEWEYFTYRGEEEEIISEWHKEHFIEHFITPQYREVYVSDDGINCALIFKEKRILITELPWELNKKYICVEKWYEEDFRNWNSYKYGAWKYIAEIPKEEPVKEEAKEMTLSELEKELWYPIKIIK